MSASGSPVTITLILAMHADYRDALVRQACVAADIGAG
jgi:hypothetical protein